MSEQRKLPDWMTDHIRRYQETDGADGHIWRGVPTLLLTTTGRVSGKPQLLPLIYGKDGDDYVVVASKGGAPEHPHWYRNLVENPAVAVQIATDKFSARARTATDQERPRMWKMMSTIWPQYDDYQQQTTREIPLVVLERV
jgi:deazaflavin-dependent oxidoreductase (nitroreductase family)